MLTDRNYNKNLHVQKGHCEKRTKCFSDVSYDLTLNLPRGEYFSGKISITFKVDSLPEDDDLQIDFRGIAISEFKLNGLECETIFYDHKINLSSHKLQLGQPNIAEMYFLTKYRTDGVGLTTYTAKECG